MIMQKTHASVLKFGAVVLVLLVALSCGNEKPLRLIVSVPALRISVLPYVIAQDQGLYEKHGLKVELWIPSPETGDRVGVNLWTRILIKLRLSTGKPDVMTNGGSPMMVTAVRNTSSANQIVLASTDCVLRAHIIGRNGITSLEELKGKRIGVSGLTATGGFHALVLARRMGWDPTNDISIVERAGEVRFLLDNSVDAIVGFEPEYAIAKRDGLPILADTRELNEVLAGNSTRVEAEWLRNGSHREAARRFLMAVTEGIALFHQDPELGMQIMQRWYGIEDREHASLMYERGQWIQRKPFPCYEGFKKTAELYDSNEMRQHAPEEFYDDSIMREIDAAGFIDDLYK